MTPSPDAICLVTFVILRRSFESAKQFRESNGYPSKVIPADLYDDFTMGGSIKTEKFYVDDSRKGLGTHYTYPAKNIQHMIKFAANKRPHKLTDRWFFDALAKYDISGAHVLIVGSMEVIIVRLQDNIIACLVLG